MNKLTTEDISEETGDDPAIRRGLLLDKLCGVGQYHIGQGDLAKALTCFEAVLDIHPDHVGAMVDIAYCLRESGFLVEAERRLHGAAQIDPLNPWVFMGLGITRQRRDDHATALEYFAQASGAYPDPHTLETHRAISLRAMGRLDEAEERCARILTLRPDDPGATIMIAEIAFAQEAYARAETFARKAISINPADDHPFFLLVEILLQDGRYCEALEMGECQDFGGDRGLRLLGVRIRVFILQGRVPEVVDLLDRATGRLAGHFTFWWQMVHILIATGESARAAACLADPPATSRVEQAQVAVLRAGLATVLRDDRTALAFYREAESLDGSLDLSIELARTGLSLLDLSLVAETAHARLKTPAMRAALAHCHAVWRAYRRDASLIENLQDLERLPAEARLPLMAAMVRANEDSAAVAVRFIGGLIEDGVFRYLRDRPSASASKRIPSRIVQYWENTLPDDVLRLMDDWKAINDDYAYERLDRASAREFLLLNTSRHVQQAFDEAPQASRRANIVRFAYLLVHGGIYADADERCLVPLREWLPRAAAFVGNRKDFGVLNCNFMAVEAGSGIMALALEGAARAILDKGPDPLWLTNGPGRLTKAVARHAADRPDMGKESIFIMDHNIEQKLFSTDFSLSYKKTDKHWWVDEYGNV